MKKLSLFLIGSLLTGAATTTRANYADVVSFFGNLYASSDAAIFPVDGSGLPAIESAFGPRIQTSTDLYDWHRGIDIDGTLNTDSIVAPIKGYFYDYRTTASGGNIVILEHHLSDFGVSSLSYDGKTFTKFYTWYLHLYDDEVAGNATSTDDIVSGWTKTVGSTPGTAIAQGTQIGILGDSGAAAAGGDGYGPHLHFELRIATNSSLEFQEANVGSTTQWGFDPHMNPLLLFAPDPLAATPTLTLENPWTPGSDATLTYTSDANQPLLNTWLVEVTDTTTDAIVASHLLDYNQRIGYDASTTSTLDDYASGVLLPHVDPLPFGDTATEFATQLVVPDSWLTGYSSDQYRIDVTATDIWGSALTTSFSAVPESPVTGIALATAALALTLARHRQKNIIPRR